MPSLAGDSDPRPVVRTAAPGNLGMWIFLGLLLLGGAWIVSLMSSARQQSLAPNTIVPAGAGQGEIRAGTPPPLPGRFIGEPYEAYRGDLPPVVLTAQPRMVTPVGSQAPAVRSPPRQDVPQVPPYQPPYEPYRTLPPLPQDESARGGIASGDEGKPAEKPSADRVRAGRLANPSLTVPLGTIIPAVLETALDSTRAGSVRGMVQRDVHSFDGSRVLIPRGSRLYGSYEGSLAQGQNRAMVTWTRLLRPDGVTIALDSQASDPLGRAGIRGKVDSKFLQRFGGAILQSVLDIGVGLATREATNGVIVALPGSTQNTARIAPSQITPTLTVKQGTSVSVYVARDLDFSSVE